MKARILFLLVAIYVCVGASGDGLPVVSFSGGSTVENEGTIVITFALDRTGVAASFQWTTADGTAVAGQDYLAETGTYEVRGTGFLRLTIVNDAMAEGRETFYVDITALTNLEAAQRRVAITIDDEDTLAPSVTIESVSVAEGNGAPKQVALRVQLPTPLSSSVAQIVVASTPAGTATPSDSRFLNDYRGISQVITFAPGEQEKTITVTIYSDLDKEDDETIELAVVQNGHLRATGRVTIIDDDTVTATDVQDTTVEEGTGSSVFARFRFTLSPPPTAPATVDYRTEDRTALAGTDYVAKTGTLTFAPGQAALEVPVEILGDSILEETESFTLRLLNPLGIYLQTDRAVATIYDDDSPAPPVSVGSIALLEGDGPAQAALKVQLAHSVTHTVRFTLATTNGTATSTDYQALSAPVTFAPGHTEVTVHLLILGDTIDEDDETFGVEVREGSTVRATATVTIVDDDAPLSIAVADVTVQENTGPSAAAVFRVTIAPRPMKVIAVDVATADGTAVADADYLPFSGIVLFFPNQTHIDVAVQVLGDSADEPDETLTLRLSNAIGATIVDDRATATIIDDDASVPATVTIAPVSTTEGNAGQKQVDLHVRLAAALAVPVTLTIESNGAGSATPSSDYVAVSHTLTFAPGQTELTVQATILGDTADEDHENFVVVAREGGIVRAVGTVTILDDDAASVFTVADTTVTEKTGTSAFAVFRVTLSPPLAANASVTYTTEDRTAVAGADYLRANGTLVFTPGQATREVSVEVFGDAITEVTETLGLRLFNPIGGELPPAAMATATIVDDDVSVAPSVSVGDVEVRENDGTSDATFTLTLTKAMTVPVKVSFGTVEHTAAPRTDYEEKSGSVTFAPGELTRTVTVRIIGDRTPEEREMFRFELRSSEGVPIGDGSALCTIVDDDSVGKRRATRH